MTRWTGTTLLVAFAVGLCLAAAGGASAAQQRDYDCADFANQAEAEEYLLPGDPYGLDADGDGIACEDLPCPCSYSAGGGSEGDPGPAPAAPPPPPKPPKLNKAVARQAAHSKAARFNARKRLISRVSFLGCRRSSRQKIRCRFRGRGTTPTLAVDCAITVIVTGEGSEAAAKLRARCRSERLLYLTFAEAVPAIRAAGEEVAGRGVVIAVAERRTAVEIEATVEWKRTLRRTVEECEALFLARLSAPGQVFINHGEVRCRPEIESPPP